MNLAKRALGVPGYLYNYVAGSKDPNAEPLLEPGARPQSSQGSVITVCLAACTRTGWSTSELRS